MHYVHRYTCTYVRSTSYEEPYNNLCVSSSSSHFRSGVESRSHWYHVAAQRRKKHPQGVRAVCTRTRYIVLRTCTFSIVCTRVRNTTYLVNAFSCTRSLVLGTHISKYFTYYKLRCILNRSQYYVRYARREMTIRHMLENLIRRQPPQNYFNLPS